jgi:carbonic anhydrase
MMQMMTEEKIMKAVPHDLTPSGALQQLKEGNFRFVSNLNRNHDLLEMVNATKDGQWPFAAIVSCMDSRTSAELIFDQGLGDIFSIRIAGNIISRSIVGSLEFATAVAGSKLILVLGHTGCGAIKGACDDVKMGSLTRLIDYIRPSVAAETETQGDRTSNNADFVNAVARINVQRSMDKIIEDSPIIKGLIDEGKLTIAGGMYDVGTGMVKFFS